MIQCFEQPSSCGARHSSFACCFRMGRSTPSLMLIADFVSETGSPFFPCDHHACFLFAKGRTHTIWKGCREVCKWKYRMRASKRSSNCRYAYVDAKIIRFDSSDLGTWQMWDFIANGSVCYDNIRFVLLMQLHSHHFLRTDGLTPHGVLIVCSSKVSQRVKFRGVMTERASIYSKLSKVCFAKLPSPSSTWSTHAFTPQNLVKSWWNQLIFVL
jgi:hypothetical protein